MDILVLRGADHAGGAVLVKNNDGFPPRRDFPFKNFLEAAAGEPFSQGFPHHAGDSGHNVVVAVKPFCHAAAPDCLGIGNNQGDFYGGVIQIHGESPVSLAENPVVAHAHAVVGGKDENGILPKASAFQLPHNLSNAGVHGRHSGIISLKPLFPLFGGIAAAPFVRRHIRGFRKGAAIVQMVKLRRVMAFVPRGMGGGIMDAQIKGPAVRLPLQKAQGVFRDIVGDIGPPQHGKLPVLEHNGVIIVVPAHGDGFPVGKALLGMARIP